MAFFRAARVGTAVVVLSLAPACVSDPTVQNDVVPRPGATQPDGSSAPNLGAAAACDKIKTARSAAATKLGCDAPKGECPGLLLVAGSVPCDEYTGGSVGACESMIQSYATCSDFDTKPCVVTPVEGSCHTPVAPEAGPPPSDAGVKPSQDAGGKPASDARE